MNYKDIVSITGLGGLYQLIGSKSDGAIVRSLADQSTRFIPARLHTVTPLESIEIYTTGSNVRLSDVFEKIKENETVPKPTLGKKADAEVKKYFATVYPNLDEDRVYASDMKKILKWYALLEANDLLNFPETDPVDDPSSNEELPEETDTE